LPSTLRLRSGIVRDNLVGYGPVIIGGMHFTFTPAPSMNALDASAAHAM